MATGSRALRMATESRGEPRRGTKKENQQEEPRRGTRKRNQKKKNHPPVSRGI